MPMAKKCKVGTFGKPVNISTIALILNINFLNSCIVDFLAWKNIF